MSDERTRVRLQRRVEDLCGAAIRAVAGQRDLQLLAGRLYRRRRRLPRFAAHLYPVFGQADFTSFRGAADGLALRVSLSDAALHARLYPADPIARLIFDLLEQFRVESLALPAQRGLQRNLRHRFRRWSQEFVASGLTESALGILLFTVAQVCRTHVTGESLPEQSADLIEATRSALAPTFGPDLRALRLCRHDQEAYARAALALAAAVAERAHAAQAEPSADGAVSGDAAEGTPKAFALLLDVDSGGDDALPVAAFGRSTLLDGSESAYRVYTRAWDRECFAADLVRQPLLAELRQQLDEHIIDSGINVSRLTRELKALLAQPQVDGWEGGHEQGRIDGRRLAQLVASPSERRLFRVEPTELVANCQLSFLIDCSGSMRQHIVAVATLVDVFSRALDMAGIGNEILGFTTGAWNGGRARREWQLAERPKHPGRLNESLHLVFKAHEQSWRRSRAQIAALLKGDLFREGIDGEAVDWACERMQGHGEGRRLLLVISDGCPMDSATQLANDSSYLEHHLRDVVLRREHRGDAEIYGIGVGLDLGAYYSSSVAIDLTTLHGNGALREILGMIARRGRG